LLAILALGVARPARAQLGASLSVASEDRFRGEPLSLGRPVAAFSLAFDAPEGPYAGVSLTGVATAHAGVRTMAIQEYAGYARRTRSGLTLDVGLTNAAYTEYYSGRRDVDYQEAYAGVIGPRFSSHLHYSPDYFGHGYGALYGEVERLWRSSDGVRLLAHLGLLAPTDPDRRAVLDWRFAVSRDFKGVDLQAAWTGANAHGHGPGSDSARGALVVSATRGF
jgi:uncharacterized protein (TIGR02001 family)